MERSALGVRHHAGGNGHPAHAAVLARIPLVVLVARRVTAQGYGAAGALGVLLVWVCYSAQVFLMGAEFTWVYARTYGTMKGQVLERAAAPPSVSQGPAMNPIR